jgi:hypothetical protein
VNHSSLIKTLFPFFFIHCHVYSDASGPTITTKPFSPY